MNAWEARQAALLLAVHPGGLGGLRLRDRHGPRRDAWLAWLAAAWPGGSGTWRRMPSSADDHRLLGGLDLAGSLACGRPVAQRGLWAECHGGLLLAPMAERLSRGRAGQLASVLDTRQVGLQREGLDQQHPADFPVVALDEGAEPDEQLPTALAERLGLWLNLADCGETLPPPAADEPGLRARVQAARARLPAVRCPEAQVQALVVAAAELGVHSLRASLHAVAAARAAAALAGHAEVLDEDAAWAARLVLAPRATCLPALPDPAEGAEAPATPEDTTRPEPPPPSASAEPPTAPQAHADRAQAAPPPPRPDTASEAAPSGGPADEAPPPDAVLQAALAALPPGLLARLAARRLRGASPGSGSAGAWMAHTQRGRPIGSRRGDARSGARLHLVDTLRAAAPWQALRRGPDRPEAHHPGLRVRVAADDLRFRRHQQRRQTVTLFVVDASGSAALHRLAEAKGAVELLLADCYVRRDQVALLAFRGQPDAPPAQLLLPPTRALARAKRCLAALPGGGGTPLAAGLDAARELAQEATRRGSSVVVVVLSDGRANLDRQGRPGRQAAADDARASARALCGLGLDLLWLDTAPQPQALARELAEAMGGRYLPLPHADAAQLRAALG